MPRDHDRFDVFVSYARRDNADGWISGFVEALISEHKTFSGGRSLTCFFDRDDIRGLDDWQHRIHDGLAHSRLFLAFLSPSYFASEWCRREWRAWIDLEIAKHVLSAGAAPIYIVEVPGLDSAIDEYEVARAVAKLCELPLPHEAFIATAAPLVKQLRRRQFNAVQPFYRAGVEALRRGDLHRVLAALAQDLDERAEQVRLAAGSESTVPPYNKRFSGRLDELLDLRDRLKDDRAGVITGVYGLGGVGKTELAFTYAHAFAGAYPGGRFLVPCEGKTDLRVAALHLGDLFRDHIGDEDRQTPERYFAAIYACLRQRLEEKGHILLVLDNVTDLNLLSPEQTDALTSLGPSLHLLATTRLAPPAAAHGSWVTLGELPEADAMELLEKHRPFADEAEREAARRIVRRLGGFALAVELVAAWLAVHGGVTCASFLERLGLEDLEALDALAADRDVKLRRHDHERRLEAVLGPALEELEPAARRAMVYAALLAPDAVPLPWLRELVGGEFEEIATPARPGHEEPWDRICRTLWRLALISRGEGEEGDPRLVRVHRLVQELVRRRLPVAELTARQERLQEFVRERAAVLKKTTRWQEARWELEPLDALGEVWTERARPAATWLLSQVGMRWHALAEWTRAAQLMRRALAVDEASYGPEHPRVARDLNNLAQLLQATNQLPEAEPLMRRALAIAVASYGPEHPTVATGLNNLAQLLKATNRLPEAEQLMRRALAIDEVSYGPEHPEVAIGLNNLAVLLDATNRLPEAEPLLRRALAIDEASYGPEHPTVATGLNNLAALLRATNRLPEAEPLMRRALAIDEASYGPEHPRVATRLNNLAQLLQATNRLPEAEPLMRRALAIDEASYGPEHPRVAIRLGNLAQLLKATNRLPEAEPLMRRALAIDEASYGPEHPEVATDLNNLAVLLQATDRLPEAEPLMRRALAIDEASYGPEHPNVTIRLNNLALLLQATNRLPEAEPH